MDVEDHRTFRSRSGLEDMRSLIEDYLTRFNGHKVRVSESTMSTGQLMGGIFADPFDAVEFAISLQKDLRMGTSPGMLHNVSSPGLPATPDAKVSSSSFSPFPTPEAKPESSGFRVRMALDKGSAKKRMKGSELGIKGPVVRAALSILERVESGGVAGRAVATSTVVSSLRGARRDKNPLNDVQDIGRYRIPEIDGAEGEGRIVSLLELASGPASQSQCASIDAPMVALPYHRAPGVSESFVDDTPSRKAKEKVAFMFIKLTGHYDSVNGDVRQEIVDMLEADIFEAGGYVSVKTASRAVFFVAFPSANQGLTFLRTIQESVYNWVNDGHQEQADEPLCLAAGLHVGAPFSVFPNPQTGRAEYVGPPVNTAARLLALTGQHKDLFNEVRRYGPTEDHFACAVSPAAWAELQYSERRYCERIVGSALPRAMFAFRQNKNRNAHSYDYYDDGDNIEQRSRSLSLLSESSWNQMSGLPANKERRKRGFTVA